MNCSYADICFPNAYIIDPKNIVEDRLKEAFGCVYMLNIFCCKINALCPSCKEATLHLLRML